MEYKDPVILCWCPADTRTQGMSSHRTDLIVTEYFGINPVSLVFTGTVDQLMWRTIVHHIPRWREPSPLRDFMRRLWPFTLWNVDRLHANWLIRCIWIAVSVVFMENNAHPVCIVDDKIPLGCGGRQKRVARIMWWMTIWDVGDDICPWMYLIL